MSPNIVKSYSTPGSTLDRRRDFYDSNRGAERPYVAVVTIRPTRPPGRCRLARDPDAAAHRVTGGLPATRATRR